VQHLKRWTLRSLLRTDILRRALPWSKLILERGHLTDDLNLRRRERISAVATVSALTLLAFSLAAPYLLVPAFLLLTSVLILNRKMYYFFLRRLGPHFLPGVAALHLLYYCYSSIVFALCYVSHAVSRRERAVLADELEVSD
jgi:hypothetical protein